MVKLLDKSFSIIAHPMNYCTLDNAESPSATLLHSRVGFKEVPNWNRDDLLKYIEFTGLVNEVWLEDQMRYYKVDKHSIFVSVCGISVDNFSSITIINMVDGRCYVDKERIAVNICNQNEVDNIINQYLKKIGF